MLSVRKKLLQSSRMRAVFGVASAIVAIGVSLCAWSVGGAVASARAPDPPSHEGVYKELVMEFGLSADRLAAAGLDAQGVAGVFARFVDSAPRVRQLEVLREDASLILGSLAARDLTSQRRARLESQIQVIQSQIRGVRRQIWEAGFADVDPVVLSRLDALSAWRGNARSMPLLLAASDADEFVLISTAIKAQERAARREEVLAPEYAGLLASVASHPVAASISQSMDENTEPIRQLLEQLTGRQR